MHIAAASLMLVLAQSGVWFHVVVEEPDETVEVHAPAEWAAYGWLEDEHDIEIDPEEWQAMIDEVAKEPDGYTHRMVRVREDDENVDIYLEKRAAPKTRKRAKTLVIDVKEDDGERVHIRLPLFIARPLARAAIHMDDSADRELIAVDKVLGDLHEMPPFDLVNVQSEDEKVRIFTE